MIISDPDLTTHVIKDQNPDSTDMVITDQDPARKSFVSGSATLQKKDESAHCGPLYEYNLFTVDMFFLPGSNHGYEKLH